MKINTLAMILITIPLATTARAETPLPLPTKGLEIVPLAQMNIPDEIKERILKAKADQERNGYFESTDKDAYVQYLLQLNRKATAEIKSYKKNIDPLDTHLKEEASEIQLAFNYTPIPLNDSRKILAYAPVGTFIKKSTESNEGWTGIRVLFSDKKLGSCAYTFFNLKLSNGGAQLDKETTEYLVNKKPSTLSITGNHNVGFLYDLAWFTPDDMSQLECARKALDSNIPELMIKLASQIDKR